MRVLFDIVHPADVLFFKRPLEMLAARSDDVLILSRHKDVACALLDEFGFAHRPVSTAGTGMVGLATELLRRDLAVIAAARKFRPDVMIGFGGVAISHAGRLLGIPAIGFYDSENARMQTRITLPFISRLYVPDSYSGRTPEGRTVRLAGTKELSYLHPKAFQPDRARAIEGGLDPDRDNFFVRVVSWRANHDIGKAGWSTETLHGVVNRLGALGRVHISSEIDLPEELDVLRYRGSISSVHHLMAQCRLFVGESATMASEAAVLGVPAIYSGRDFPGYVRALETAGLIRNLAEPGLEPVLGAIDAALARPATETKAARDSFVASCPDWAEAVIGALDDSVRR